MTSDIVEKLRDVAGFIQEEFGRVAGAACLATEAADTITSLSEQNKALDQAVAALEQENEAQASRIAALEAQVERMQEVLSFDITGMPTMEAAAIRCANKISGKPGEEPLHPDPVILLEMCEEIAKAGISDLFSLTQDTALKAVEPKVRHLSPDDVEKAWQYAKERWCCDPDKAKRIPHLLSRDDLTGLFCAMGFEVSE